MNPKTKTRSTRMGRPPKPKQDVRSKVVLVRLTRSELADLTADGKKLKLPLSNVLRLAWQQQRKGKD